MLVSAGLIIPDEADATTYSGNFVPGSKKVVLKDCSNVVSNNFVNGTLMIVLVGRTFTGCDVEVDVFGNRVGGNLEISVSSNTVYYGNMRVKVHDNPQIGGVLKVEIKTNKIHPRDPHLFLDYNLFVKIEQNGGNALDMKRNEVIAAGFQANIKSNWVKNSLYIDVKKNFVGLNYKLLVKSNIVNNIFANVEDNKACKDLTISFLSNTIDTRFKPLIQRNRATKDVLIQVNDNSIPYLDPRELDARILDNHAATGKIRISVDSNNLAKTIKARIEKNGAHDDGRFSFRGNWAIIQNEIHILDNRVDGRSTIVVMGNQPPPTPYVIKDNWACKAKPKPQLQPTPTTAGNIKSCTQQVPGDADNDGLTNDYEQMIGTNPNYWDTDYDGLFDGWGDYSKDGVVDRNEARGEIGHPLHPRGKTHMGAVDTLFNHPKEAPNCFKPLR